MTREAQLAALQVQRVLDAIGNVASHAVVDGVLYTLAVDRIVRVNDVDTGLLVSRVQYPKSSQAAEAWAKAVAMAERGARS